MYLLISTDRPDLNQTQRSVKLLPSCPAPTPTAAWALQHPLRLPCPCGFVMPPTCLSPTQQSNKIGEGIIIHQGIPAWRTLNDPVFGIQAQVAGLLRRQGYGWTLVDSWSKGGVAAGQDGSSSELSIGLGLAYTCSALGNGCHVSPRHCSCRLKQTYAGELH